ncbi:MAG TPA: trehalose-6-phosphate synthase [Kofleriaceae bacterium]|nr:trehalose-6-phosphate synthase [Kofleriaceae bacterium]
MIDSGLGKRRDGRRSPAVSRTSLGEGSESHPLGSSILALRDPATSSSVRRTKLVVVSNRAPGADADDTRPHVSGLANALEPALGASDGIWLGWSGREEPGDPALALDAERTPARATFHLRPEWRRHYQDGFCNQALWPLLHSFPSRVRYSTADWNTYVEVNDVYARFATELVDHDGVIWVHDYHLLLVAQSLRTMGYDGAVGLFLHAPFPEPDVFATLPWGDDLLAAMCAFDLVGFHTDRWADNFRACVRAAQKTLRVPKITVHPIAIDPSRFQPRPCALDGDIARLRNAVGSRRIVLGVDRLDYAKGIPERLRAFDRLLAAKPEWHDRVCFVQISVPSREHVPGYAELRHEVEALVGRINGRYGEADWVPVHYLYRSYEPVVLAQLYREADVALVTPLRDGMNLVAKEFVAAQDAENPGVLVLSQFAGASAELTDAIITNPYHPDGLAEDLERALCMSRAERCERYTTLAAAVGRMSPRSWTERFTCQLHGAFRSANDEVQ